jgi:hypothetical protein
MDTHVRNTRLIEYTVGANTVKVASDSIALIELGTAGYSSGQLPGEGRNRFLGPSATVSIGNSSSCGTVLARGNFFASGAGAIAGSVDTSGTAPTEALGIGTPVEAAPPAVEFILLGVSPNPISQAADILFEVGASRVKVAAAIYDVSGRLVRRFKEHVYDAGRHSILWNGRDEAGRPVPNGLFFLRISVADKSPLQSRLVVLR